MGREEKFRKKPGKLLMSGSGPVALLSLKFGPDPQDYPPFGGHSGRIPET